MQRANALDRLGAAAPVVARQGLGELALLVQVRVGRKRTNEAVGSAFKGVVGHDGPSFASARGPRCGRKEGHCSSSAWPFRWEVPFPWTRRALNAPAQDSMQPLPFPAVGIAYDCAPLQLITSPMMKPASSEARNA